MNWRGDSVVRGDFTFIRVFYLGNKSIRVICNLVDFIFIAYSWRWSFTLKRYGWLSCWTGGRLERMKFQFRFAICEIRLSEWYFFKVRFLDGKSNGVGCVFEGMAPNCLVWDFKIGKSEWSKFCLHSSYLWREFWVERVQAYWKVMGVIPIEIIFNVFIIRLNSVLEVRRNRSGVFCSWELVDLSFARV